ncbi:MAG: hypothetical protein WAV40_01775 [Microgenomates group bacterium]
MVNQNIVVACIITAVLAGGVGYKVGTSNFAFGKFSNTNQRFGGRGQNNYPTGQGMMGRGGALTGEVTAKDGKTLTVKLSDGSSKLVIFSDTTTYRTAIDSSMDKVEVGTKIAAFGTTSTDGSTVATSIEINPLSLRK